MPLTVDDAMQMSPIFIGVFMIFTSLFNGDVKALVWLGSLIVGMTMLIPISMLFNQNINSCKPLSTVLVPVFGNYPNLSVSTFMIVYTLIYLILPMRSNNDWNYYVIVGFIGMFMTDTLFKLQKLCTTKLGIFTGTVLGGMFSILTFSIIKTAGGDKLLYYNTISSNNVYCSKPKKQQFKCYVYKNGEKVSAIN